jgi:hypothetical protein
MAYQKSGKIEAEDLNQILLNVNSVLSSLGQTTISNVVPFNKMTYTEWKNVIETISNLANQQGTTITSLSSPILGDTATYAAALMTNQSTIVTNKFNAKLLGTFVYNGTEITTSWKDSLTFTQSVTFTNATMAQYYFNAGGQFALQFVHPPSSTGIDGVFNGLATNCGTIVLSGHNSGTRSIAGVTYNGVTKIGSLGNTPTISANLGYAGLNTNRQSIFKQIGATYTNPAFGGGTYSLNNIEVFAYTSNNGATINFESVWDEIPNGLSTGAGSYTGPDSVTRARSTTYLITRPPSTTYITKSWGTIVFAGSVAGA